MNEDRLYKKIAWRLIPFITLLYVFNFLDRVNVGFAALTMNEDLGFSPGVFGFGAGILSIGYALFQVPANVVLERMGARRWICTIMLIWGTLSALNAFVQTPLQFYVLRFCLGAAEAGFVPGIFYYLTVWFPPSYRARFVATFMTAAPTSAIIGGPLSGFILGMGDRWGWHSWQWLFLLEALPTCLLALTVLKYLPDGPHDAPFLDDAEREVIIRRMRGENPVEHRILWRALTDPRIIAMGLVNFGILAGANGVSLWLPQIVKGMGFTNMTTGLLVALPNLISTGVMVLWGRSSDARGERVWHVAIPAIIASTSFFLAAFTQADMVMLFALGLTQIMLWSAIAPLLSLPGSFLGGSAAAGGIALVVSIGQIGSFIGSTLIGVLRERTGSYSASMAMIGTFLAVAALIALGLKRHFASRPRVASSGPPIP